ncbi:MAG: T9SS type A sorting domain-containing protein [Saprospiraceae bacterium]|nr:T9SS type A sorting domain-containing protein [Saprospiraceae bacterium]
MKNHTLLSKSFYHYCHFTLFFLFVSNLNYLNATTTTQNFEDCYLPAPQNAQVTKVNSYSASVKWDRVEGGVGYFIKIYEIVNEIANPIPVQEYEQTDTVRLFNNLASGRKYKVTIGAICPLSQAVRLRDDNANTAIVYAIIQDDVIFSKRPTNPFNSQINLTYEVATEGIINIGIFDANGTQVLPVITDEYQQQGTYQTDIKTEGIKPGMYFLNFRRGKTVKTIKLIKLN